MNLLDRLFRFYRQLFGSNTLLSGQDSDSTIPKDSSVEPNVLFNSLSVVEKTPSNEAVGVKDFIAVVYKSKPLWTLFRCPCECGNVISLSLQRIHSPNWTVSTSQAGRPTLYPSVWQNKDCFSHFWVKDGRVYWCNNTGIEPWVAEPRHYTKLRSEE